MVEVWLNITYPDNSFENISITNNVTCNTYYCNRTYSVLGKYNYTIWANDTSNNQNISAVYTFNITDTTLPQISNVQAKPESQVKDGYVNITCTVTDNVEVSMVKVNITGPAGFIPVNTSMIKITSTDNYYYNVSYSIIGTYYYSVWVNDTNNNQNKSLVFQFQIYAPNQPPNASFTYSPISPTTIDIIQFTDTSTDSDGTITEWHWGFGDGSTSTLQNPTHQYADNGNYTVTLVVMDNDGATDSISKEINVSNVPPIAEFIFYPTNPSTADTIQFNSTSSYDPDGYIVSYSWTFDDGNNSIIENPTHQYSTPGIYTVILTVTDNDYESNVTSQIITVLNQQPTIEITYPSDGTTVKNTILVTGTADDPDGNIVKVEIKINSGSWTAVTGTTSWTYSLNTKSLSNGQHTISVRSYDGTDYSNIESVTVNVNNAQGSGGFIPGFECLFLIGGFIITILLYYKRKKYGE